ncbi:hypothetical protein ACTXPC_15600 [Brachybacterium alimentarium]|uniref:hypothetical protein n=1 Tax=Brachybacterium alimentarium TaxID=47845 RepID=UPI003FD2B486
MSIALASISGLVSVATLVGIIARLTGPERARRRALQAKEALDNAPAALQPAFEKMHWEASVHLVAMTLCAASYGRFRGLWVLGSVLSLLGVGVFSVMLTVGAAWDTEEGLVLDDLSLGALCLLLVISIVTITTTGAIEGSRREFYRKVFDKLYAREDPEKELLMEARTQDFRRWSLLWALLWALSSALLVTAMGVNAGITARGTQLEGAPSYFLTGCLVVGIVGVAVLSWLLLVRWTRRPLHMVFSSLDEQPPKGEVEADTGS